MEKSEKMKDIETEMRGTELESKVRRMSRNACWYTILWYTLVYYGIVVYTMKSGRLDTVRSIQITDALTAAPILFNDVGNEPS